MEERPATVAVVTCSVPRSWIRSREQTQREAETSSRKEECSRTQAETKTREHLGFPLLFLEKEAGSISRHTDSSHQGGLIRDQSSQPQVLPLYDLGTRHRVTGLTAETVLGLESARVQSCGMESAHRGPVAARALYSATSYCH